MFTMTHAAVGALTQRAFQGRRGARAATAAAGVLLHAIMDNPKLWHAPYPWPPGTPAILRFLPYPHDLPSSVWVGVVLALTLTTLFLLWRFWWGMLWANAPDIADWLLLRPMLGVSWIHDHAFPYLYEMWGAPLEIASLALIVALLFQATRPQNQGA